VLCVYLWVTLKYTHLAHEAYVLNIRSDCKSLYPVGQVTPDTTQFGFELAH